MNENYFELNTDGIKKKAVKAAGINFVTHFLNFIFHTASVIILARLLTPTDFGLVAMVTAFSLLPMNFGWNGFPEYILQKQSISNREINAIFWVQVYIASFLSLCFVLFGFYLIDFYAESALSGIAAALALTFILVPLSTTHRTLLRREMKFTSIAVGDLIARILSIICAIAAAILGMAYWAIVIRQLVEPILMMFIAWFLCPWRPGMPTNLSSALPGFKFAIKVYLNFTIDYLTKSIDKIFLGKFHGPDMLGNYDRAYHLSSMPGGQILIPLRNVALATLSRLRDDKVRFHLYYTKALSLVTLLGTIAAVVLMLTAQDLVPLLLGPEWNETGLIVMAFSPGIAAMLIDGTIPWLHLSLGTPGRWVRWNIFASIITIVSFIIVAPYGAVAMAAAFSSAKFLLVLPGLWYAGRPIEFRITALLRSIWTYLTAGLSTSLIFLALPLLCPSFGKIYAELSPLNRVIITVLTMPLLYITILVILQRSFASIRELIGLVRMFLSR